MAYIIKISDTSPQALSIVNMLKTLAKDYDFLQVTEEPLSLTAEEDKELSRRYKHVLENPSEGKTWDEFQKTLDL